MIGLSVLKIMFLLNSAYSESYLHHEARSEPLPFDIMSATTKKDFRKRSHVDSIIFTEIRAKKPRGGAYLPPPALNRVKRDMILLNN